MVYKWTNKLKSKKVRKESQLNNRSHIPKLRLVHIYSENNGSYILIFSKPITFGILLHVCSLKCK